jgi:hypothetical protein
VSLLRVRYDYARDTEKGKGLPGLDPGRGVDDSRRGQDAHSKNEGMKPPLKIVSGGQNGAGRAALEWALTNDVPHGGWCPKGRKAEDGIIPPQFQLAQTVSENSSVRTRRNVQDSGATVIFSRSLQLTGGTRLSADIAKKLRKPFLHLLSSTGVEEATMQLNAFIREHGVVVLNVAGPPASDEPEIGTFVEAVLSRALRPPGR